MPGIVILRIGASMYFANVSYIRDYITKMLAEFAVAADHTSSSATYTNERDGTWIAPEPIRYIVIEMTPVASVDSTALHMLEDMHRDLKERGIRLAFTTISTRVEDTFKRAGLIEKIGEQWFHPSVHSAVKQCMRHRTNQPLQRSDAKDSEGGKVSAELTEAATIDDPNGAGVRVAAVNATAVVIERA